ncbi:MAG: hypothetical protein GYA46_03345 [candidate division Zixibacteria bacterium]|nr:hypothetical protein [candidate division Zixibacteria bacterium]
MKTASSKNNVRPNPKPQTVDDYLASVPRPARSTLVKIRADIRAAAPGATEKISWGMPTFYHQGGLVGFAAFKNHCSLFVMSGTFLDRYRETLDRYEMTKSAIHFPHDQPLPSALVKKIVRARLAENARKAEQRKRKR